MNVTEFVKGNYPECKKSPKGLHVKVKGMGVKKPYCLYCLTTQVS